MIAKFSLISPGIGLDRLATRAAGPEWSGGVPHRAERPEPWQFWFRFALKTASARKGAILDLTWDRIKGVVIDLEYPNLGGKRKGRAQVHVAENFLREIEARQKASKGKYVVADWCCSQIGAKRLHHCMVALHAQAGTTDAVGFHTFRHSMATKALANTETPAQMLEFSERSEMHRS